MRRILVIPFWVCIILLMWWGCQKNTTTTTALPTGDTSELSLDWAGTYTGVIPCADCEGIATTVDLNSDRTYRMSTTYKGKSEEKFVQEGTFFWNELGNIITLNGIKNGASQYLVGENTLFQLDLEGNRITGNLAENYQLLKTEQDFTNPLAGKKWTLTEIMGRKLTVEMGAVHLEFDQDGTRVSGFGGCNNYFGECEVKDGTRIKFYKMGRTKKFCEGTSKMEDDIFKIFMDINSYSLGVDGMLRLNRLPEAQAWRYLVSPYWALMKDQSRPRPGPLLTFELTK
ncbi:MAG TPA: copper resistance protein NlpE N-terminal domain-containing protein [Lunatimonas sp.]|nr:copper resistance protein NlpE N-terminal domain-containing protein [Lunatimonas sp.]